MVKSRQLRVCFFAKVRDRAVLQRNEFYAQDIRILEDLNCDVEIVTSPLRIPNADLYFVWWWTWAFAPVIAAKLRRRPVIITGTFDRSAYDDKSWLKRALSRFALAYADANVFVSQMETRDIAQAFHVARPSYSPHIVDTSLYHPAGPRDGNLVFSVIWTQTENAIRKCASELIAAAHLIRRKCPDARFVIAGEHGSGYPQLKQQVENLGAGDYIAFPGAISREEKISMMQRCAIYLQPSRFEGFGVAMLEAMSCGAPIVTSPVGAVPEVVADTAVFVDGKSPEMIASAVFDLLSDSARRDAMGARVRERAVAEFAVARRRMELKRIIDEIV